MEIVKLKLSKITPYAGNAKKHPKEQVAQIKQSIQQFGMNDPIAVWGDKNIIVEGHGRYMALKEMGVKECDCIRLDHLSDEERRAYTLAHNQLTMATDWDYDALQIEMDSLLDFDMEEFGFDMIDTEAEHEKQQELTQDRVADIENLGKGQFDGSGYYDIPVLEPVHFLPPIKEWIGFNYVLSDKDPQGKAVHFFIDDYQFERIWNNTDAYVEKLKQYVCVATPDFSPYGDMPLALQIYNHYRKHWVGAYLQAQGVTVVPTIRASSDPRCFDWYLEGEPHDGIVLISSMWATTSDKSMEGFRKEYETMYSMLNPRKIFVYGREIDGLSGEKEYIKSFAQKRFDKD